MKTKRNIPGNLLVAVAFGGWILVSQGLCAQEEVRRPDAPPVREARDDAGKAPQAKRLRLMMREMLELQRSGKPDAAREMAGRIRGLAGDNPRVAETIKRAMDGPKPDAKPDRRTDRNPERPMEPARMKIQKLRQAAELLQSAGYEEQAAKVRAEIGRIEGEVRRAESGEASRKVDRPRDPRPRPDQPRAAKPRIERPAEPAPIMEELKNLRREMEELRGQVRRLMEESGPRPMSRPMPGGPPMDRPMVAPR